MGCRKGSSVEVDTHSESASSSEAAAGSLLIIHSPVELKRGWRRQKRYLFLFSDRLLISNTKYVCCATCSCEDHEVTFPWTLTIGRHDIFFFCFLPVFGSFIHSTSAYGGLILCHVHPAENTIENVTGSVSLARDLQTSDKNKRGNCRLWLVLLIEGRLGGRRWECSRSSLGGLLWGGRTEMRSSHIGRQGAWTFKAEGPAGAVWPLGGRGAQGRVIWLGLKAWGMQSDVIHTQGSSLIESSQEIFCRRIFN